MQLVTGRYESVESFVEAVFGAPRAKGTRVVRDHEISWCGLDRERDNVGDNASEAVRTLIKRGGWAHGAELVSKIAAREASAPVSTRRRNVRGDYGDEVDMQRVYAGRLDAAWSRPGRASCVSRRLFRIVVNCVARSGFDAERMAWRGVAALRLADLLSSAGYGVQIETGFNERSIVQRDYQYSLRVVTKRFEDPVDLQMLAATTALPGFFRALGHDWHAIASPVAMTGGTSYRVSDGEELIAEVQREREEDGVQSIVVLGNVDSEETATEWVEQQLLSLQGEEQ